MLPSALRLKLSAVAESSSGASTTITMSYRPCVQKMSFTVTPNVFAICLNASARFVAREALAGYRRLPLNQLTFLTGGISHEPLTIEGSFSFGQYMRSIRMNLPDGAGSQLDSLSEPGESF